MLKLNVYGKKVHLTLFILSFKFQVILQIITSHITFKSIHPKQSVQLRQINKVFCDIGYLLTVQCRIYQSCFSIQANIWFSASCIATKFGYEDNWIFKDFSGSLKTIHFANKGASQVQKWQPICVNMYCNSYYLVTMY